jgi:cytochrome c2
MRPPVKRAIAAAVGAAIWAGAAIALFAERARPPIARATQKLRDGRSEYWIWPATLGGLVAVGALVAMIFYGDALKFWEEKPVTINGLAGARTERAPALIVRYGCAGCHIIPGVPSARGLVGPSLAGFAGRLYVGGALPNEPSNLVKWLVNPRAVAPHSAMPITGISEDEARSVAAYLYSRP